MALETEFVDITLDACHGECEKLKADGWRFIQTHCVNVENGGVDVYYSFMKGNLMRNLVVRGVTEQDEVQSVTDVCLAAFVFENEARELFGLDMKNIAIDFGGKMYDLAETTPMCYISPEVKAEKEKAKKMALAMEAKKKKAEALKAQKAAEAAASEKQAANEAAPAKAAEPAAEKTYDGLGGEHPTKIDKSESGKVADVSEIPTPSVPSPHSLEGDAKAEQRAPMPSVAYPRDLPQNDSDTTKEGE